MYFAFRPIARLQSGKENSALLANRIRQPFSPGLTVGTHLAKHESRIVKFAGSEIAAVPTKTAGVRT
jgi:hypothetical protein